jgi:hypothetical protein
MSREEWSLLVLLEELALDLLLLLILLLLILLLLKLLLLIIELALLLLHEKLLMLLLLLKLVRLLLLEILVLQSTLSGHVRSAGGQVDGGGSWKLKKWLNRATTRIGGMHQVRRLAGGCLWRAVCRREEDGRSRFVFGPVARASFAPVR